MVVLGMERKNWDPWLQLQQMTTGSSALLRDAIVASTSAKACDDEYCATQ